MMMIMMMICSITNIDPSTIAVKRVSSLDDGSERVDDDDDEFLMMLVMMMTTSMTKMITIVVQRVLSLDDGSERVEGRPPFKSWLFRCSPIRWSIVIVIIYIITILNMLAYIIIIHLFYPINPSSIIIRIFIIQTSSSTTLGSTSRPPSKCRCVLVCL